MQYPLAWFAAQGGASEPYESQGRKPPGSSRAEKFPLQKTIK